MKAENLLFLVVYFGQARPVWLTTCCCKPNEDRAEILPIRPASPVTIRRAFLNSKTTRYVLNLPEETSFDIVEGSCLEPADHCTPGFRFRLSSELTSIVVKACEQQTDDPSTEEDLKQILQQKQAEFSKTSSRFRTILYCPDDERELIYLAMADSEGENPVFLIVHKNDFDVSSAPYRINVVKGSKEPSITIAINREDSPIICAQNGYCLSKPILQELIVNYLRIIGGKVNPLSTLPEILEKMPPLSHTGMSSLDLGSIPLSSAGLGSLGLGSADLGSVVLGSADLGSLGLGSVDLGSVVLGSAVVGPMPSDQPANNKWL